MGRAGEAATARWYEKSGYAVVARNWRCRQGELDLVVRRGPLVVVCEVKTRRTTTHGAGVEALDVRRQHRLRQLTARWLATERPTGVESVRIDVASVTRGRIEVDHGAC